MSSYAESCGIFVFFELKSKLQTDIVDYEHGFPVCWRACTRRKNFDWTKTRESIDDRRDFALLNCVSRPSSPTIRYDDASSRHRGATHQVRVKKSQEFFFNLFVRYNCPVPRNSPVLFEFRARRTHWMNKALESNSNPSRLSPLRVVVQKFSNQVNIR